jgi:hypothetical protein
MINDSTIIMTREKLYNEIWEISLKRVAEKYNLNYAKFINSCKEYNIPCPTSAYWTKKHMGMDVSDDIISLPESEEKNVALFLKPNKDILLKNVDNIDNKSETQDLEYIENMLSFLEESELKKVKKVISELDINKHRKLHKTICDYINNMKNKRREERERNYYNPYYNIHDYVETGYFADISKFGKERCMKILSMVYFAIENLGGKINEDFSVRLRDELHTIQIEELKDKVNHELTKDEALKLLEHEEKLKRKEYTWQPNIRKYDYIPNGKLKIIFESGNSIKDTEKVKLEDKLGNILIELYEQAEKLRIARMAREESEKKRREEEEKEHILNKKKKEEAAKVLKLVNESEDYSIATKIRVYVESVVLKGNLDDETKEWIKWAKEKADWYDPTIAMNDELLGKRAHWENEESKYNILEEYASYRNWE